MIANGKKIKINTATPVSYTKTGLEFEDGSTLQADVMVFATGFEGNMRFLVDRIFGEEIGDQMGDYWGLNGEGEIRGAWKECGREFYLLVRLRNIGKEEKRGN